MSDLPEASDKVCPQCGRSLPATAFHRNKRRADGLAFYCKSCAAARSVPSRRKRGIAPQKKASAAVPEAMKWCPDCEQIKPIARGRETKHRLYGGSREYHLRRRYGIGETEFQELLAAQGGVWAVCGDPDPEHVDHDHRIGWVRGILCFNCNGGLGHFRDDQSRLARAITYLRGTTWQRVLIHPGVYQMHSPTRGRPPSPSS